MSRAFDKLREPRNAGIFCALAATGLGLAYLAAAGAPARYLVVNAVALLLGLVALRGFAGLAVQGGRVTGPALVLAGSCLLATALFGTSADGAARWVWIGPLSVQPSLVLLPLMILAFARRPDPLGTLGIAVAALALALQPDRAMAGVLALALAALAAGRPGRWPTLALLPAGAAFAATLARPDSLPAVPYVDRILVTAFDVHPLAGAAVLLGALLLAMPSIVGARFDHARGPVYLVFGATWLGCVAAAALGNYPTPVVGYGGSAVLGYLLSLAVLPAAAEAAAGAAEARTDDDPSRPAGAPRSALPA